LANDLRSNHIFLSNAIEDVKTNVYKQEGQLFFTFEIPVLEEKNLYTLYKAQPIPIFLNDSVIQAKISHSYYAYASANNEFTQISSEEHHNCKNARYCKSVDILRPVANTKNCVIKALETSTQICEFETIENREPFYKLYGDILIYSVRGPLETRLICKGKANFQQNVFYLNGVGAMKIAPECKIEFADNYRAFSNPEPSITSLGEVKLMDVFNFMPNPENFTVKVPEFKPINYSLPILNLTRTEEPAYIVDILYDVVNARSALPDIFRALIAISIICVIILIAMKLSTKFNVCCKTFVLWKNPKIWWEQFKHYDITTFTKMITSEAARKWFPQILNKFSLHRGPTSELMPIGRHTPGQTRTFVDKLIEEERRCNELLEMARPFDHLSLNRPTAPDQRAQSPVRSPPQSPSPARNTYVRQVYPHVSMAPLSEPTVRPSSPHFTCTNTTPNSEMETIVLNQPTTEFFITPRI
jgi:hypothetical protein